MLTRPATAGGWATAASRRVHISFDADGKLKNGIVAENDSLYYYKDGVRYYAGPIEIDGSYYYVGTSGEVVHGCSHWITKTNGLMSERSYTFDDNGRMTDPEIRNPAKDGIVAEDGSLYYYRDGVRYYAGPIEIDGSYYYVDERRGGSRSQLLDHQDQWSGWGAELSVCRGRQDD